MVLKKNNLSTNEPFLGFKFLNLGVLFPYLINRVTFVIFIGLKFAFIMIILPSQAIISPN